MHLFRDDHRPGPVFTSDWSESALARVVPAQDNRRLSGFLEFIRSIVVCRLHPPAFRTDVDGESSVLSVDGANFGAWYRSVLQEHPHLAVAFNHALGDVIDGIALYGLLHLARGPATSVFVDEPDNYLTLAEIQPWAPRWRTCALTT